ncbi:MAG: NIF family HAD-type phosphatase [Myxococcota bacterium]
MLLSTACEKPTVTLHPADSAGTSAHSAPSGTSPATPAEPSTPAESELDAMTLPPRPDWADKYAGSSPDERFFDIAMLMQHHDLDRAHAVELQNHFRDLTRLKPKGDRQVQYAEALQRAKQGVFEDRRKLSRLARARLIVVFDLDETLYDQYIDDSIAATCHDLTITTKEGRDRYVKLTPGWADAIHRIHDLGGEVVLFSANLDDRCYANARAWMLDGVPIDQHPAIAGFLTNSHLVLQPKQAGSPVVEPSKDLRIVDPDLSRAIIVDDNPRRLFQLRNVRVFKKFQADVYCTTGDPDIRQAHEAALRTVVDEIEDSVRFMEAHEGMRFVDAYLPYTVLGRLAVRWIQMGTGSTEQAAINALRANPEWADQHF